MGFISCMICVTMADWNKGYLARGISDIDTIEL